ncbi:MAG: hypothetical protein LBD29_04760 [Treponema sp.]|nr:hypothetical protein [Treponema sp.]
MTEPEKTEKSENSMGKTKYLHHYIFPCLVYIQEKINAGELTIDGLIEVVTKNAEAHGHDDYKVPEDWKDQMPHLVNKFGWRVFELPNMLKEQREAAVLRKAQKRQERLEKQHQEKSLSPAQLPLKIPPAPPSLVRRPPKPPQEREGIPQAELESSGAPKKKIIVVKKKN